METKQCNYCNETKTIDQFYKSKQQLKSGVDYYCKYCRNGNSLKSQRGGNTKPCSIEGCPKPHYALSWCRMHYARFDRHGSTDLKIKFQTHREYTLRVKYLMSMEEFNKRAENGCEICGDKPNRTLQVDHDHNCCSGIKACKKCVRGVVCNKCNINVGKYEKGLMRDDNPHLEKVKEYLDKYSA